MEENRKREKLVGVVVDWQVVFLFSTISFVLHFVCLAKEGTCVVLLLGSSSYYYIIIHYYHKLSLILSCLYHLKV